MPQLSKRHTRKIALVGLEWVGNFMRLLAGGLDYVGAHPNANVVIRPFTKVTPLPELAAQIEGWGAEGIYGAFPDEELRPLKAALKHPIPIVNNSKSSQYPGVFHVLADSHDFIEMGVEHLRHLGLKHFGILYTDPLPGAASRNLTRFKEITGPHGSVLMLPIIADRLLNTEWDHQPELETLAAWLQGMPKPCGVLCQCFGSGKFLIERCAQLGLKVPDEIAIIGSDDAEVCLSCTPTLTSITPNKEKVGAESIRILVDLLDGKPPPARIRMAKGADLVVRESTGQQQSLAIDTSKALEYINANATRGITVTELIRETQRASQPIFYQAFRKATGKTPAIAIRDRQLDEVRRLLRSTHLPIKMISQMSGFSSPSIMTRLFSKVEGMPPLAYRERENKS
jgi:LacI family transcriptional regulator